ncbi:hypothetical protein ACFCVW_30710 [Bacillus mobilis]|uniref:hypothetical protein n=1 Tax=Bacillus mobilis TaxID=2026190 RepID=UPI0035DB8B4D
MAKLHKELACRLLSYSTKEKEEIGSKIVLALGGDPTKTVTGLPARRGNSDGGIDGRIPILIEVIKEVRRGSGTLYSDVVRQEANAAFCIKLQSQNFTRDQLGAFIEDMRRERIFDGIIVTVLPLSQDAEVRFKSYNEKGDIRIRHILIEELLANDVSIDFELVNGESFQSNFLNALKEFTQRN